MSADENWTVDAGSGEAIYCPGTLGTVTYWFHANDTWTCFAADCRGLLFTFPAFSSAAANDGKA